MIFIFILLADNPIPTLCVVDSPPQVQAGARAVQETKRMTADDLSEIEQVRVGVLVCLIYISVLYVTESNFYASSNCIKLF